MYKVVFIFFITFGRVLTAFALDSDSLIYIKGYYVTQFLKKEISFSYEQKIKKMRGESYSIPIDYTKLSFFIPIEVGSEKVVNAEVLSNKNLSVSMVSLDSLFFLPTNKRTENYILKMFGKKSDLSRDICILSEFGRLSPYYSFANDSIHLYKCVYLESWALEKRVLNIESERVKVFLDIDSVNRKSKYLTLFFMTKIAFYTPIIDIEGTTFWMPYTAD